MWQKNPEISTLCWILWRWSKHLSFFENEWQYSELSLKKSFKCFKFSILSEMHFVYISGCQLFVYLLHFCEIWLGNEYLQSIIMVRVSLSLASWNGAVPQTSMYRITPNDHISVKKIRRKSKNCCFVNYVCFWHVDQK